MNRGDQLGYHSVNPPNNKGTPSLTLTALTIQLVLNGCMRALCLQYTDTKYRISLPFVALVSLFQGVHTEGARHMGVYL
jgi:hypothetical protein